MTAVQAIRLRFVHQESDLGYFPQCSGIMSDGKRCERKSGPSLHGFSFCTRHATVVKKWIDRWSFDGKGDR